MRSPGVFGLSPKHSCVDFRMCDAVEAEGFLRIMMRQQGRTNVRRFSRGNFLESFGHKKKLQAGVQQRNDPASTAVHTLDARTDVTRNTSPSSRPVDEVCRIKMCQWCYQVVDSFKFQRETVQISMSFLDRFLCTDAGRVVSQDRSIFQLAALTALHLAVKIHESRQLGLDFLSLLSRGLYSRKEIEDMELSILKGLEWHMYPPSPIAFLSYIICLLPANVKHSVKKGLFELGRYQIELSVFHSSFSGYKASDVAMASVLNVIDLMDNGCFSVSSRDLFVHKLEQVLDFNCKLCDEIQTELNVVFSKGAGFAMQNSSWLEQR